MEFYHFIIFQFFNFLMLSSRFTDIHTHCPGRDSAIVSVTPDAVGALPAAQSYSLQLHPWHLPHEAEAARLAVEAFVAEARRLAASDPRLVAIGECGLDGCCDVPPAVQQAAFVAALRVAQELDLPVIVHCVRRWGEMLAAVREVYGTGSAQRPLPVIIHGFRRGPELARQLLDAGLSLSLGRHFNPEAEKIIPPQRCYRETDDNGEL